MQQVIIYQVRSKQASSNARRQYLNVYLVFGRTIRSNWHIFLLIIHSDAFFFYNVRSDQCNLPFTRAEQCFLVEKTNLADVEKLANT